MGVPGAYRFIDHPGQGALTSLWRFIIGTYTSSDSFHSGHHPVVEMTLTVECAHPPAVLSRLWLPPTQVVYHGVMLFR